MHRRPLVDCPICEGTGSPPPFKLTSMPDMPEFGGTDNCPCVRWPGNSRAPEFRARLQRAREDMEVPAAGNDVDPEASAEAMKPAHAAADAGDDQYWPPLPPWTDEQKAAAGELHRGLMRVWELMQAFKDEENDSAIEENIVRIVASIPDRDLRDTFDYITELGDLLTGMRSALIEDPRGQPEAEDYEHCKPVTSRSEYAKLAREREAQAYRLERLAQTEPAAG
jgi:hypothetical protein